MRWFLDTEFHEDGRIIDLISIALLSEEGDCYYAVSNEFDPEKCNEWVKENVLPKLPPRASPLRKSRAQIAGDIRAILLAEHEKPEIWGYFCDYDWVVLCQLYGRMIDLPKGFPFWCRDLKQLMQDRGIEKKDLPAENAAKEHNALADACWIRDAYAAIVDTPRIPLAAKIRQLRKYGNEIAIGWNDCGCFWTLHYGRRGAGSMIEGAGLVLHSETNDFEEAVDEFLAELLRLHGPR